MNILFVFFIITDCSGGARVQAELESEVSAEQQAAEDEYLEFRAKAIEESNELLSTFNQSLDRLYDGQVGSRCRGNKLGCKVLY